MSTIALYYTKANLMSELINDVKTSVGNYITELTTLSNQTLNVNKSICNLDDVISSIQSSTQTQERRIDSLEAFRQSSEDYFTEVVRIDSDVADAINQSKEDFYEQYNYLKPEKSDWDKFCDGLASVGKWCKEKWESIVIKTAKNAWDSLMNTIKVIQKMYKVVVGRMVENLILLIEDVKNFDINNTDVEKVRNATFFSAYKGAPVFYVPKDSMKGSAFSFGVIVVDAINKADENLANTLNHEYGHTVQLKDMGIFGFFTTVAMPSVAHCWLGDSKYFDDKGWSAYNSYYEKPYEYGADLAGGVIRTEPYTVDIHAGEWYETYFNASIFQRMKYFFYPQQLFQDSKEVNWYSYSREDYQNQMRTTRIK